VKQKILWLDCETTGLSPQHDLLLELAIAEADLDDPFEIGPIQNHVFEFVDQHTYGVRCKEPPAAGLWTDNRNLCPACLMNEWARKQHTSSGLLEACARSIVTVREIEDRLLERIPEVDNKDDRPTLAGRGVHFDLNFLRLYMPRLAARLSHRVYDVSAVALFCESLGMPRLKKREAHRAHDDILESIEHARQCAAWLGFGKPKDTLLISEHRIRAKTVLPALVQLMEQLGDEDPLLSVIVEKGAG
jgi:oligoribonuclease